MIAYDLHVHTCLSGDGADDLTPIKVIDQAIENGLDIVAITDHNSIDNVQAAADYVEFENKDIVFIPGIEVESSEEVHVTCLFPDVISAKRMARVVRENIHLKFNKPKTFGHQYIVDEFGEIIDEDDKLLRFPTKMNIEEIFYVARQMKGVAIYSHLEHKANSVLSVLGTIPERPEPKALEISNNPEGDAFAQKMEGKFDKLILRSSNAHSQEAINTRENSFDLEEYADAIKKGRDEITAAGVIEWLRSYEGI